MTRPVIICHYDILGNLRVLLIPFFFLFWLDLFLGVHLHPGPAGQLCTARWQHQWKKLWAWGVKKVLGKWYPNFFNAVGRWIFCGQKGVWKKKSMVCATNSWPQNALLNNHELLYHHCVDFCSGSFLRRSEHPWGKPQSMIVHVNFAFLHSPDLH